MADRQHVTASIGGGTPPYTLTKVDVHEAVFLHDVVVLEYRVKAQNLAARGFVTAPEGTPVVVTYGESPHGIDTWYGYVHHPEIDNQVNDSYSTLRYVCVGTSWPLDTQRTRAWKSLTSDQIVSTIAREQHLRTVASRTGEVLPFWPQDGLSDFALLRGRAKEDGYRLWISRGTCYYLNPAQVMRSTWQGTIPVFTMGVAGSRNSLLRMDTVSSRSLSGEDGSTLTRTISGLGRAGGGPISVELDLGTSISLVDTSKDVTNYSSAMSAISSSALAGQFWVTAEVELLGAARVHPGSLVSLAGKMRVEDQGRWLVRSIVHSYDARSNGTTRNIISTATLERNSRDRVHVQPSPAVGPVDDSRVVLRNGRWEAPVAVTRYV